MAFLKPDQLDHIIRNRLLSFLKKKYKAKVLKNHIIFNNIAFAPDFYVRRDKGKGVIVIFRNPPDFPDNFSNEIRLALKEGLAVYIAIYNNDFNPLLDELISKCDQYGVGIMQCSNTYNCQVLQPSISDYPKFDKIIEGWLKIFISSKLWIIERDTVRKVLKENKYQPICVERISNHNPVEEECYKWIDKSPFFIGVITRQYRLLVDKEIRYALKKKRHKSLIYIKNECFQETKHKLKRLIKNAEKNSTYYKFNNEKDLKKMISIQIAELIGKHTK